MQQVARVASGYVYYVSLKGVTGSGALDTAAVEAMLPAHPPARAHSGGRGLWHPRCRPRAQAIGKVADAVVIGSRIIQLIEDQPHDKVVARDRGLPARRAQGARRIK